MQLEDSERQLQLDVESVQKIPIISTILNVVCETTNMGFAAVARVSEDRWIACSVLDKIKFGLKPSDELKIETTLCQEVRLSEKPIVIDDVSKNDIYCLHRSPAQYQYRSYISMPITRKDGSFFGTLCAIDPKPASVENSTVVGMFSLFTDLISFHLHALEQLEQKDLTLLQERAQQVKSIEQKNEELQKMNLELESFAHIASHDLQEPLRKIHTFSNFILRNEVEKLSESGQNYFGRLIKSVNRMQILITDLITYTRVKGNEQKFENLDMDVIIEELKQDFQEEISQKKVEITIDGKCTVNVVPFQFKQVLQNLISNSIKFSRPGVPPVIEITCTVEKGEAAADEKLSADKHYSHITFQDNGIGFQQQFSKRIFAVFERLHGREEYDGTGIGLSIVKKIIDNHRGVIIATGEVNKGARFDIYLPAPQANR